MEFTQNIWHFIGVNPNAKAIYDIEDLESRFDDLRCTQAIVEVYHEDKEDDDVEEFFTARLQNFITSLKKQLKQWTAWMGQTKSKNGRRYTIRLVDDAI